MKISSHIRSNIVIYFWMMILTMIIGVIGTIISYYFHWGLTGTGSFLFVAAIVNFVAYFYSDTMILRCTGAKPVKKNQAPEYYEIVELLCKKASLPMPKLYILDENTMNAFATGRNHKRSAVAVTRGLLQKMTPGEVEGVIAHELSHIQNYDMRIMAVVSLLASTVTILADIFWYSHVGQVAQDRDNSGVTAWIGIGIALFAPLSAFLIQLAISRKREYLADADAARLTGKPLELANALRKISLDVRLPRHMSPATSHLFFSSPNRSGFIERIFSTHPPIEERIEILEHFKG